MFTFDMEITLAAEKRQAYPLTSFYNTQRKADIWLIHLHICVPGYDGSQAMLCTLQSDNECRVSFSVEVGDSGTTVYNLLLHGTASSETVTSSCHTARGTAHGPVWGPPAHTLIT